jgi:sporulation protein YlmC with PRC-barrel domain
MAAMAVSGLMLSTALAQSTAPSNMDRSSPNATTSSPSTPSPSASTPGSAGSAAPQAITSQAPGQWLATKFKGTNVLGADGNKIGDVSDILFDKDGKVHAVIVGVGGFLGIGQKDVALPLTAFVVMPANSGENKTNSDELKLSMTKDQLQQMAEFKPLQPASTVGAGSPTGSRPAPSPMSPANPNR